MTRSDVTIDLGALRRNVRRLRDVARPAQVWAVVKADAYGHGAADAARVALEEGATGLCVATAAEGAALRPLAPDARIVVMGPSDRDELALAREADLEVAVSEPRIPDGLRVHLKVDTGMGRFGMTVEEALACPRESVVGLMSHLATADEEHPGFARAQIERFAEVRRAFPNAVAHLANSAATLRFQESRFDAVRCGIALYGLSPFGDDPAGRRARARPLVAEPRRAGEGARAGREHRLRAPLRRRASPRASGSSRSATRTASGAASPGRRCSSRACAAASSARSPWTRSPSSSAAKREGAVVTLIGDGVLAEEHARVLGTINYEITCGIRTHAGAGDADGRRWMSACSPRPRARRPISSAAPSATSCSAGPSSTWTSPAREPERAARAYRRAAGGAVFPLSERHGAWRVAFRDGRTVDFTPLRDGIEDDLRTRDFTVNAIARPLGSREHVDPLGGRADLDARVLRAVSDTVFTDDPLRLLRAARLEDELGFRLDPATEELVRRDAALVTRPAGERILGELVRLSADGWRRLEELGLLGPLGGSLERLGRRRAGRPSGLPPRRLPGRGGARAAGLERDAPLRRAPARRDSARGRLAARDPPVPPRDRAVGARGARVPRRGNARGRRARRARARPRRAAPARATSSGSRTGPEVGRLLDAVEEERAAGTISTREEALELVARLASG